MATGGVFVESEANDSYCGRGNVVKSNYKVSEQDYPEQLDEITALESIYGQKVFRVVSRPEDGIGVFKTEFSIPVHVGDSGVIVELWLPNESEDDESAAGSTGQYNLPVPQRPKVERSESGQRQHVSTRVRNLPPLVLHVSFPPTYPSQEKPIFDLSCGWLNAAQLSKLCEQLDQMWMEELPVMFTWVAWLQNETLSYLQLDETITLAPTSLVNNDVAEEADTELTQLEERLIEILSYDHERELDKFKLQQHECEICFDVKYGSKFFLMPDCGHAICRECVQGFCQVHVSDGTVLKLSCPMDGCKTDLPHYVIRSVLNDEEFQRWEKLLDQRVLDSVGDVLWCPRCNQAVVKEPEEKLHLAYCLSCSYGFCTECMDAWHAGKRCETLEDILVAAQPSGQKRKAISRELLQDSAALGVDVIVLKRSTMIINLLKSRQSLDLIKKTTVPCPVCHVPIEKNGGCNHMNCSKCHASFCYDCGVPFKSHSAHQCKGRVTNMDIIIRQQRQEIMNTLLADVGATPGQVVLCPQCKQRNVKSGRNNHMRCWQCKTGFCFLCKTKLRRGGHLNDHFNETMPCVQHSD